MMQNFKIVNSNGKVLREFKTLDKPETWARFLQLNESLVVGNRTFGRLSILGKQYYSKRKNKIPLYATN